MHVITLQKPPMTSSLMIDGVATRDLIDEPDLRNYTEAYAWKPHFDWLLTPAIRHQNAVATTHACHSRFRYSTTVIGHRADLAPAQVIERQ
jgi:hypothetical protein